MQLVIGFYRLSENTEKFGFRHDEHYADVSEDGALIKLSVTGNFSCPDAVVDLSEDRLVLRRDAFGRLPLYWAHVDDCIWFSTHVRSLMNELNLRAVSPSAFHAYSSFSFVPNPLSPIAGIHSVIADRQLTWSRQSAISSSVKLSCWSEPDATITSEQQAIDSLRSHLDQATNGQISDLPNERVAVFLSGGLDSALTAAALRRAGLDVTAYSLDFGAYGLSELPFAQEVADHLKIPLKIVPAFPSDIRRALMPAVSALDTAFGDGVTVPLWLLNEAAAQDGIEMVFNGEGGDQLFGGWTNKPLIASSVYGEERNLFEMYLRTFHRLHGYERLVLTKQMQNQIDVTALASYVEDALSFDSTPSLIHLLRKANLMLKGAQNIQPRASNLAIAHGLHLRSLFCDRRLAAWTFTVAPELMLRGACEKYILKRAVESWLPESIVFREKRGMGVPLSEWCLGPLWSLLGSYLNVKRLERTQYWQSDLPIRLAFNEVSGHLQGRRIGESLWLMLMWESWLESSTGYAIPRSRYNSLWAPLPLLKLFRKETVQV